MKIYKECTAEKYYFLVNDAILEKPFEKQTKQLRDEEKNTLML